MDCDGRKKNNGDQTMRETTPKISPQTKLEHAESRIEFARNNPDEKVVEPPHPCEYCGYETMIVKDFGDDELLVDYMCAYCRQLV